MSCKESSGNQASCLEQTASGVFSFLFFEWGGGPFFPLQPQQRVIRRASHFIRRLTSSNLLEALSDDWHRFRGRGQVCAFVCVCVVKRPLAQSVSDSFGGKPKVDFVVYVFGCCIVSCRFCGADWLIVLPCKSLCLKSKNKRSIKTSSRGKSDQNEPI